MATPYSDTQSDDLAEALHRNLTDDLVVGLPTVDLSDSSLVLGDTADNPLYASVTPLSIEQLTERKVCGDGVFDALMDTYSKHLQEERSKGRITGTEYTNAYIQITGNAMSQAIQFLMGKDQAYWSALLVQGQAKAAEIAAIQALVELERTKVIYALSTMEVDKVKVDIALGKMQLAQADAQFDLTKTQDAQEEYKLQTQMPIETQTMQENMLMSLAQRQTMETERSIKQYQLTTLLPDEHSKNVADLTFQESQIDKINAEISALNFDIQQFKPQQLLQITAETNRIDAEADKAAYELSTLMPDEHALKLAQVDRMESEAGIMAYDLANIKPAELARLTGQTTLTATENTKALYEVGTLMVDEHNLKLQQILNMEQDVLKSQKEVEMADFQLTDMLPAQLTKITTENSLTVMQTNKVSADRDNVIYATNFLNPSQRENVIADTAVKNYQATGVLPAQVENVESDTLIKEYTRQQILPAQRTLYQEQAEAKRAETLNTRTDGAAVSGSIGKQKELYTQQIESYKRDAETKVARLMIDSWITQKGVTNSTAIPSQLNNTSIDGVVSRLKNKERAYLMGLFSSKTKYYVASQIYNMAGDLNDREDYMKSLTIQSALLGDNIALRLRDGIMNGPGFSLRSFQRWANTNYSLGIPTADIDVDEIENTSVIRNNIPVPEGSTALVLNAVITDPDTQIWAERHLAANYPALLDRDWTVEQDDYDNEITISFGGSPPDISFIPTPWNEGAKYIAARYLVSSPGSADSLVSRGSFGPYRTLNGVGISHFTAGTVTAQAVQSFNLVRRVVVRTDYKDSTPSEVDDSSTDVDATHTPNRTVYTWDQNKGFAPNGRTPLIIRHIKHVYNEMRKVTNVTRTTVEYSDRTKTTTVYQDVLVEAYRFDYWTQNRRGNTLSEQKVFLYRIGSGNAELDAVKATRATLGEFFPMFPLRLNNNFIDNGYVDSNTLETISEAYKKSFGSDIDDLLDELKDNDDIDDIDFIFMVYGVHINERDKVGRRYMYEFFKNLIQYQKSSKTDYINYRSSVSAQNNQSNTFRLWENSMSYLQGWMLEGRNEETDHAPVPQYPVPERSHFVLDTKMVNMPYYKITISWSYIKETLGFGVGKAGAKTGDCWFETGTYLAGGSTLQEIPNSFITNMATGQAVTSGKVIYLIHQTSALTYRKLEIAGLEHSNYVYKNKYVHSDAYDNILNNEDESPFFIPLHYPSMMELSLNDQNQLAYCSRLLLLNSYEKVKVKWYQRGIFKVIFAIAMIAISFITLGPAGFAAMPGLLGTNAAVGAMLGLAGATAAIAGAVANMVAAMILTVIIQKASISLFGEKWGQLIGTIVSFVAMQVGYSYATTGSFNLDWGKLFTSDNLIKMTSAVSKGYSAFMNARIEDLQQDYESASDAYKNTMEMIQERYDALIGTNASINPLLLTEMAYADDSSWRESSESFLSRTLLTGSDIAEVSMAAISEFPRISIDLPDAIY